MASNVCRKGGLGKCTWHKLPLLLFSYSMSMHAREHQQIQMCCTKGRNVLKKEKFCAMKARTEHSDVTSRKFPSCQLRHKWMFYEHTRTNVITVAQRTAKTKLSTNPGSLTSHSIKVHTDSCTDTIIPTPKNRPQCEKSIIMRQNCMFTLFVFKKFVRTAGYSYKRGPH